jgi:DnaJ family protein C protein 28
MKAWDELVEKRIQQAMEEGRFDDLPGAGQPLDLEVDPHEDPDMRLAHHLLRNSGFTLPWIEERREIEAQIQGMRTRFAHTWRWLGDDEDRWREGERDRTVAAFRRQVVQVNRRIADYNLIAPTPSTQRPLLDPDRELLRLTAEFDP